MKLTIAVLGGGPCGLGAAWRLNEEGHRDWHLFEKSPYWGGLSTSFVDEKGYTWDVGGHVLFSHYDYFDRVLDQILPPESSWLYHERESWIRIQSRWVPYPFQMNIRHLEPDSFLDCLKGIIALYRNTARNKPANFYDWLLATFGSGLVQLFLKPYNWKVWGHPPELMSWDWVGERVAVVDLERIIENYVYRRDDVSWGPNSRFRFPLHGGTGQIWNRLAEALPADNLHLREEVSGIDLDARRICFSSGRDFRYDYLVSSLPLPSLHKLAALGTAFSNLPFLETSSTHVVGVGIRGRAPQHLKTKCWMYFPEDNCPFYRVTHFSHYSPNNVPDIRLSWSLMAEVSETSFKPVDSSTVVDEVLQGFINTGLVDDRKQIEHVWYRRFPDTYPIPTVQRDETVSPFLEFLERYGVLSRGRMGAWKYEVGNMDHSFMQGKESVDRILHRTEEATLNFPHVVNAPKSASK